jgi:hypothetical protein
VLAALPNSDLTSSASQNVPRFASKYPATPFTPLSFAESVRDASRSQFQYEHDQPHADFAPYSEQFFLLPDFQPDINQTDDFESISQHDAPNLIQFAEGVSLPNDFVIAAIPSSEIMGTTEDEFSRPQDNAFANGEPTENSDTSPAFLPKFLAWLEQLDSRIWIAVMITVGGGTLGASKWLKKKTNQQQKLSPQDWHQFAE